MRHSIKLTSEQWDIYEQLRILYRDAYYGPVGKFYEYLERRDKWLAARALNPDLARMAQQSVDRTSQHR